jgi:hypothetical protein
MNAKRVVRNMFGADMAKDVLLPVAGGVAGFMAGRTLGNLVAMKDWGTTDPRVGKLIAAGVGIPATFALGKAMPLISKNSGAIVLGMGMAAAEAWLRNTPLLGGSPAAAEVAVATEAALPGGETAAAGFGAYYTEGMLGGLGIDDPADQSQVDGSMDSMESVSTVIPTDMALTAPNSPQFAPVKGDKGYAGGVFARHLFSGMMGG